jgi:hypothetical protein
MHHRYHFKFIKETVIDDADLNVMGIIIRGY